jgi:dihydropteroate synthase
LLQQLEALNFFNLPILVGFSRKSMITKVLGIDTENALNGTTILNTTALLKGASILRVHDVKEAMECIRLTEELKKA